MLVFKRSSFLSPRCGDILWGPEKVLGSNLVPGILCMLLVKAVSPTLSQLLSALYTSMPAQGRVPSAFLLGTRERGRGRVSFFPCWRELCFWTPVPLSTAANWARLGSWTPHNEWDSPNGAQLPYWRHPAFDSNLMGELLLETGGHLYHIMQMTRLIFCIIHKSCLLCIN